MITLFVDSAALQALYADNDKHHVIAAPAFFVTMREQKLYDVFTFDHHFKQMGFRLWPR